MDSTAARARTLTPPITVQQWGELEGPPHYDLVDGRLKEKPDVAFWHEIFLMRFSAFIHNYLVAHGLGMVVTSNAKLKISDHGGREPDLFFIPTALDPLIGKNLFKGVPPLVVEVLSPSNAKEDRGPKAREYASLGVEQYWIVDSENRCIEVFHLRPRPEGNVYELAETVTGDAVFRPALFPGLEIPLGQVWPAGYEDRADD